MARFSHTAAEVHPLKSLETVSMTVTENGKNHEQLRDIMTKEMRKHRKALIVTCKSLSEQRFFVGAL